MLDYFFNDEETVLKKREKKKKLHELLNKYGSVEGIENKAIGADGYDYMFANTDNLIDEVLQERRSGSRHYRLCGKICLKRGIRYFRKRRIFRLTA